MGKEAAARSRKQPANRTNERSSLFILNSKQRMSEKRNPRPASTANASATVKAIKRMQRAKADREENTGDENTAVAENRWAFANSTKEVQDGK